VDDDHDPDEPVPLYDGEDGIMLADEILPKATAKAKARNHPKRMAKAGAPPPPLPAPPPLPPPLAPPPIVGGPICPGPDLGEDGVMLGEEGEVPAAPAPQPRRRRQTPEEKIPWTDCLWGSKIKYEDYNDRESGNHYTNYKLQCALDGHVGCEKKRGAVFTSSLGSLEPIAFLLAWHRMPCPGRPGVSHAKCNPEPEDVKRMHVQLHDEIKDIKMRLHR
jgi:hypothetical protein